MGKVYLGNYSSIDANILIVASRFNESVVDSLVEGARSCLVRHGVSSESIDIAYVPGANELPLFAKLAAQSGKYGAVICLGAIIRGSTSHYDVVVSNMASGILRASLETNVPVIMGVLTTETIEQAQERAGIKAGNKGFDSALAALEMYSVLKQFKDDSDV